MKNLAKCKAEAVLRCSLIFALAVEIIGMIYINLFPVNSFIDHDYAKLVRHMIEIANHHSYLLRDWNYITTGEFDCSLLLAVPIYMLTHSTTLSFGIANIINIIIWAWIVWTLLSYIDIDTNIKLLVLILIYAIYDYGMLSYTNMMFFCGGQYVYKALLPILLITLFITSKNRRNKANAIVFTILYFLLLLISAISSGVYVFICGIAPIIVCQIVFAIREKKIERYNLIMSIASVIITLGGIVLCKILDVEPDSSSMVIRFTEDYLGDFLTECNDVIHLFNPFTATEVSAVSIGGIVSCLRWIVVIVILLGLSYLPEVFGIKLIKKNNSTELTNRISFETMMISVFVWNFLVLYMTTSTPRYQLIGAIPVMLLGVIRLSDLLTEFDDWLAKIIVVGLAFAVTLININGVTSVRQDYYAVNYSSYASDNFDMADCSKLIGLLNEYDVHNAFFVNIYAVPELMRALDIDHSYESYNAYTGEVLNYDFYYTDRDRSAFSDGNILVVAEEDKELLPDYVIDNYEKIDDISNYEIWYSATNPFDGITYIKSGLTTVDLATTPGYTYEGVIDGSGYLHSNSGTPLTSADFSSSDEFTLTINYEASAAGAQIELYRDGEILEMIDMAQEQSAVLFENLSAGNYKFVIVNNTSTDLTIKEIVFN